MKHKCKITVIKKECYEDLQARYLADPGSGPCHYKAGQEFICDRHREPEGMCGEAWKCIQHYAYALYHGADTPFGEGWMRKPGVAIATCNDGIRPVTFKLERIEMEE